MKLAPLVRVCRARPDVFETFVCLSGQHRDLVAPLVEYFDLKPACDLRVMSPNQNLAELTSRCIRKVDDALGQYQPDFVIVQGDTTTAAATAQAALYRKRAIVHVEAGLRTGNIDSPFPEEFNRRVVTLTARLHCAPTEQAAANLRREGIAEDRIRVTGNTGIDSFLWTVGRERERPWNNVDSAANDYSRSGRPSSPYHVSYGDAKPTVLITAHRRESFGDGIASICDAVKRLAQRFPDHAFLWPLHPNPKIEKPVRAALKNVANVSLVAAVEYPQFVSLMDRSTLILSDSGGVQEEAPSLGKPVLVLRADTERPEGIEAGCAELVGTDADRIVERAAHHLEAAKNGAAGAPKKNPYGDGLAAERIADWLAEFDADKL